MHYSMAVTRAGQVESGQTSKFSITLATGTYHRLTLYGRASNGGHEQAWSEGYSSKIGGLEIEADAGNIIYQRTLSPASAEPLERYGVVLPEGRVDWGSDTDWVADFGPMGEVTRRGMRSPTSSVPVRRGRVFASHGEEVVGGAVSDASTTSGD